MGAVVLHTTPKREQNGPELKEVGVNGGSVPREDNPRGGNYL